MASTAARVSLEDVRASVQRMQSEGERLVRRIRRDAKTLLTSGRRQVVNDLVADARRLRTDLRQRAEHAVRDLDARRARLAASLEEQTTRIVETVAKRLNVAIHDDVAALGKRIDAFDDLRKRVHEIERRLEALAKDEKAA